MGTGNEREGGVVMATLVKRKLLLFKMFIFVKETFYIMFYGAALCTHYSIG